MASFLKTLGPAKYILYDLPSELDYSTKILLNNEIDKMV